MISLISKAQVKRGALLFLLLFVDFYLSIILFDSIVLSSLDKLDGVAVNNKIIGQFYIEGKEVFNIFLNGNIDWLYLDRIFNPIILLYTFFKFKTAYFIELVLFKYFAFYSFYRLSKFIKIPKNNSVVFAILYSVIVTNIYCSSIAILFYPYFLYIFLRNKNNYKDLFLVLFVGLNSSIPYDGFALPFLWILYCLLQNKIVVNKKIIRTFVVFYVSIIISNIHLFIGFFFSKELSSRSEFYIADSTSYLGHLQETIKGMLYIADSLPFLLFRLPLFIIIIYTIFSVLKSQNKKYQKVFYFYILIYFFVFLIKLVSFKNNEIPLLDIFNLINFQRIHRVAHLIILLLIIFAYKIIKKKYAKFTFIILTIFAILLPQLQLISFQIIKNLSFSYFETTKIKVLKKNIMENNFQEVFKIIKTAGNKRDFDLPSIINNFDNYYKFDDYSKIKKIVLEKRVMSIGIDPMVAVANNIKVIDGYHGHYPLLYKYKFRKIIEEELEKNIFLKNYYDKWGARVYAFYNDQNNLGINFDYAKLINADYVISSFKINNKNLTNLCNNCFKERKLFLYKIK